jgi:hypothetical protein
MESIDLTTWRSIKELYRWKHGHTHSATAHIFDLLNKHESVDEIRDSYPHLYKAWDMYKSCGSEEAFFIRHQLFLQEDEFA